MALVRRAAFASRETVASEPKPDGLLLALGLMIWTNVWRIQDVVPVLGAVKLNLLAVVGVIALFALDHHPARRLTWLKTPIMVCGLVLLAIAILGVPMSLWPRRSAIFVLRDLLPNVLLAAMIAASVRGMRDLEWMALVNLVGAFVYCLFAFSRLGGADGGDEDLIYYDANDLALVLVCTIPFAIFFLVRRGWVLRALGLASLVLFIAMLGKTDSRGGLLGFVAVLVYLLFAYRVIPRRVRVLAVAGGIGALALFAEDSYWETMRTLGDLPADYNWSGRSTEGRMAVWSRGLQYMSDDPFLGVGLRNFSLAEGMLSEESKARAERGAGFKWSVAHNSFLEIGVELGVIALVVFVVMLGAALRILFRVQSARPLRDPTTFRAVALAGAVSASFIAFIICGIFVSAGYFSFPYLLLGMTMGFAKFDQFGRVLPPGWLRPSGTARATLLRPFSVRAREPFSGGLQFARRPGRAPFRHRE